VVIVTKAWGREEVICNEPEYCAKWLHIAAGKKCSLHYHPRKKETFTVQSGEVCLEHNGITEDLKIGDQRTRTIQAGFAHRFSSRDGALLLEVSTHHDDSDVVRIEPSRDLKTVVTKLSPSSV
jgi:mannose-6-phosphate isomerase-like protein (cupin superfamily)